MGTFNVCIKIYLNDFSGTRPKFIRITYVDTKSREIHELESQESYKL